MAGPALHIFIQEDSRTYDNPLTRREIYWQMKDRASNGYGFSLSQVEPVDGGLPESVSNMELDSGIAEQIREELETTTPRFGFYAVPEVEAHDIERLASRLSLSEEVIIFPDLEDPSETITSACHQSFWSEGPGADFPVEVDRSVRAALNIAHPYMEGTLWHPTRNEEMFCIEGDEGRFQHLASQQRPIYTAVIPYNGEDASAEVRVIEEIEDLLPKQDGFGGWADFDMRSEVDEGRLKTECVSPGSVLVPLAPSIEPTSDEAHGIVEYLDGHGISISGIYDMEGGTFLLFKLHPRAPDLDEVGPRFSAENELWRLRQTQWARETLKGYKAGPPGGQREMTLDRFDGWRIWIERPGRKAADDFTVHVDGPRDSDDLDLDEGLEPFTRIFTETMYRLHSVDTGEDWLDAIWRLWRARDEPKSIIHDVASKIIPCEYEAELDYDARAMLWIIGLVFIVEDVNYRFNFHPLPRSMVRYRKQGRDQPMNAILQLGASPLSDEEAHRLGRETVEKGGTYELPDSFQGPDHLRGWYMDHLGIGEQSTL